MDRWMSGCMEGERDGWMDRRTNRKTKEQTGKQAYSMGVEYKGKQQPGYKDQGGFTTKKDIILHSSSQLLNQSEHQEQH